MPATNGRPQDRPLIELIGAVLAETDPDEQTVLIAMFEMDHVVMPKAEFNSMLVAVANKQAEYQAENNVLRSLANLPALDSVDEVYRATDGDL